MLLAEVAPAISSTSTDGQATLGHQTSCEWQIGLNIIGKKLALLDDGVWVRRCI